MGVNDIMMAVQYRYIPAAPLNVPIIAFDGLNDYTIDRGNIDGWAAYTAANFKLVPVQGDHYFVSTHYRLVSLKAVPFCACSSSIPITHRISLRTPHFH